ncbi:radical SAM family heme chaperone HemW [Thermodesulfobacteriota bacterium]
MTSSGKQFTEVQQLGLESFEGPAGIYVHIPFCQSKCPYCSFVSYQNVEPDIKKSYMQALGLQARDMAAHPWSRARKFKSLYIGGGTPSTVDITAMVDFIASCLDVFDFISVAGREPEVAMEVNPNSVNREMLGKLKQAGVNRLSIGIQSFSDGMLKSVGRAHSALEGVQAVKDARNAGFANISLDLMYGLPGQDLGNWQRSLEKAVDLAPEHLSVYELTIEQDTPFADLAGQGKLDLPDENSTIMMFESAREILTAAGYSQYEISNYAREGFRSLHNINYWENGSYVGLGSGAVSCFSGLRIRNEENPVRFINMITAQQQPFKEGEFLSLNARFCESVVMGLRMTDGVSTSLLEKQYGMTPHKHYGERLEALIRQGFLEERHNRLRLTKKGALLANRIMAELVS